MSRAIGYLNLFQRILAAATSAFAETGSQRFRGSGDTILNSGHVVIPGRPEVAPLFLAAESQLKHEALIHADRAVGGQEDLQPFSVGLAGRRNRLAA